jgi:hypothetical protein
LAQLRILQDEEKECSHSLEVAEQEIKKIADLFSEEERQIERDQKAIEVKQSEFQTKLVSLL